MRAIFRHFVAAAGAATIALTTAQAQLTPPQLSSRPGAAYTLYLNFGGFNYPGTWGGKSPGNVSAYDVDGNTANFSSTEIANMKEIWARVAQKYVGFDVDVTTIDPAPAGSTAAQRKAYYNAMPRMMHGIIGGSNSWYGGAGGVSYVGTTQHTYGATSQYHTNWVFPKNLGNGNPKYVAEAAAHEHGHGCSCYHQRDEITGGGYSTNNGAAGPGSYAPTMGVGYYAQRSTWRQGSASFGNANDVEVLLSNLGIGPLLDDGIGHTLATATPLVTTGNMVDSSRAKGFINPASSSNPMALGENNYTADFFKFTTLGGAISLSVTNGTSFLEDGVADPGATLQSVMRIYDSGGALIGTGVEDSSTLFSTFDGSLSAGTYYLQVAALGGYVSSYEPNSVYYTMGGYFVSGTFNAVPEPASFAILGLGVLALRRRAFRRS